MTTNVTIKAHCATTKEVVVKEHRGKLANPDAVDEWVLEDGEELELVVYDDKAISVFEREKQHLVGDAETTNGN